MNSVDMQLLNEELNFTGYTRINVKSIGNEIVDITSKIELASSMVEEGILDPEVYKKYVLRQKVEIKDMLSEIYTYLRLADTKGLHDDVFNKKT